MLHIIFILSLVLCLTDAGAKTQKVDKGGFRNPVVKLESRPTGRHEILKFCNCKCCPGPSHSYGGVYIGFNDSSSSSHF